MAAAGGLVCRRRALSAAAVDATAALRPVLRGLFACGNLYRRVVVVNSSTKCLTGQYLVVACSS